MTTIDSNNCIPRGLRVDIMRCSMENKNLLSKKGSIYVGTGESITVGGEKIYKTKALEPGLDGEVLQVKNGDLGYDKIQNAAIDGSIIYTNLGNTLKNVPLQNSQFKSDVAYKYLQIANDNIDLEQQDNIAANIFTFPSGRTVCDIESVSSNWNRRIVINRDEKSGRLGLAYENTGGEKGLYQHDFVLIFSWTGYGVTGTITAYLFYSFVNNYSGEYELGLLGTDAQLTEIISAIKDAPLAREVTPKSVYYPISTPEKWYGISFGWGTTKESYLGLMVNYYDLYAGGFITRGPFSVSQASYRIQSQTVTQLLKG